MFEFMIIMIVVMAVVGWLSGAATVAILLTPQLEEFKALKAKTRYLPDFEVNGKTMNLLTISGGNVWYEVYGGPHGHELRRLDYETNDKITRLLGTDPEQ